MDIPHTTHELAALLETIAQSQADTTLAQRLRDWSREVAKHGDYSLRARGASIQNEIYETIEAHLAKIERAIVNLRDVVGDTHLIAQDSQHRLDDAAESRDHLTAQIVSLSAMVEQIRSTVRALGADLAARPSAEEAQQRMAQIDDHEARLDDHEGRIGKLEGNGEQEATG